MNKGIFRLVFDARRGMHVPAAECVRGCGKRTSRQRSPRSAGAAVASALALLAGNAEAARPLPSSVNLTPQFNLPQAAANFNQLGRATQAIDAANAQRMIVNQTDQRVILNWSSFDIGSGYTVRFVQPTGGSALNRIGSSNPSVILGNLEANGEVILYNANGMLFGKGATVNTGNFIATTLNIADEQFEKGYRNITSYTPAFQAADGEIGGFIRVEAGASINAASGGDILMFAPRVLNEGRLSAPGGQVALAAGQKVYLAASLDPAARGLLVEVDPFATADKDYNTVENAATGSTKVTLDSGELVQRVNEIVTERGTINLVGLSVKQNGTARATTAVKGQNGAIYLLAHGKTISATHSDGIEGHTMAKAVEAGELVLGATSVTRVDPDASNTTQLDAEYFYNSIVRLEGKQVHLLGGAQIIAPGAGSVTPAATATNQETKRGVSIVASATPLSSGVFGTATSASDDSWIVIDPKVLIDVSGTNVNLPMSRNVLTGRLFAIQLADSPLQRTGVLYRTEVSFDRRKNNNTGLKVANVSDFYGQIARTAAEKLSAGGTISIKSDGAVVVGQRARLDVSGGTLNYAGGEIRTTLLRQGNRLIDIADARADVIYDEVITPSQGRYEAGYVEGKDAGTLTVAGRRLVLDGELAGKVVAGPYQRGASAESRPLAGRLQVGIVAGPSGTPDYYVNNLVLSQTRATALAESFFASPFATGLGARGETATISADALQAGGFGRVELLANELFSLQTGTRLNLGAGGSFSATAGHIDIGGSISAPAGSITLTASPTILTGATPAAGVASVVFSEGANLSTAGYWSNDGRNVGGSVDSALANDGGAITVAAYDSIVLPTGAALDVSAGAWRNASGKLSFGKAGSIELAANAGNSDPLLQVGKVTLDGSVSGFGFSGGGTFKLTTLDLSVSDAAATAGLNVKPGFFSANGFENITLNSIRDLSIAENTTVNAQLRNRALNSNAAAQQSGSAIAAVSHLASSAEVDAVARKAVNLAFAATRQPSVVTGTDGANLVVGKGATIATEAGGSLSFSAGNNLTVAGTLSAPGGSIALTVEGTRGGGSVDNADKIGFDPAQALWLTDSAKIQAGGGVEYANSRNGMKAGQVYGGGTVKLNAKHGYLIAEEGSEIDIRGYETTLDVYKGSASTLASRAAGTLSLSSPEGILVDSTINAAAPESGRAAGGTLEVSISRQGLDNFTQGDAYSTAERRIVVRKDGKSLPAAIKPGDDLNSAVGNGVAAISAKTINTFSAAKLRADDRIEFAHDVDLATTRSLELDTRVIAAQGNAAVTLAAPYVALGNIDIAPITGMSTPTAGSGAASFTVTANLVDVVGTLGLQGFATSSLNATRGGRQDGEIRLRGRAFSGTTAQTGALLFAGQLKLTAGQIYPTTFSDYAITGLPGNSTISTFAPQGGSTAALPLSAFGKLKLSADKIEHGGVIRAPFGQLELNATNKLTLDAGSELSVAGSGLTVPVGNTVNGTTWYYRPLGTGSSELVNITALPLTKQILLSAGTLDASAQARVSAAGGGDVQASEFVVGAGGSTDYLASTKGLYAVLPNYKFDYAPYDAQIYANSDLKPGEQIVVTMAGSKLAPGTYTLLPAIYALLSPDAVLVSRAADQGSSALPAAISQTDGSAVVTAYRSVAGTTLAGDDYQRYVIEPAATFRAKSSYTLTSGSDFFAAKAAREGSAAGSLPRDAGRISLSAAHMTNWQALFDLAAPAGAKGGEFDLAVPDIVVVKNGQSASENHTAADGYTVVSTESLAATGAASILLGGTRSDSNGTTSIATSSDKVRVESDMNGNELLFAAKTEVAVADNVTISTSGSSETVTNQLKLSGDGAFLRVSKRRGVDVVRSGAARAPGVGTLTIGQKVKLAGAQVDVDATGKMSLDGSAVLAADAFGLGAGRISFGGASPEGDSVSIGGKLLETLGAASSLSLRSYSTIDFLDSLDLALPGKGKLVLDAAGLRGLAGADGKVNLGAAEVVLRNSTGQTVAATGQGTLNIAAKPQLRDGKTGGMEIGPGNQSLGFDSATLSSTGDMIFSGSGQLASQGDLTLATQRVTASSAADQTVVAGGVLTVDRRADGRTLGEGVGLGAKLKLSGERVVQNGTIDLAGGQLTISAANTAAARYGVEFGSGSVTRAGGFSVAADEWTTYGDAGSIKVVAAKGDIKVDGIVGVAALAGGGNAGSLSFNASNGTLDLASTAVLEGAAGSGGEGGSFSADLGKLTDADKGSIDSIVAATSSFNRKFDLRVRKGDVALKSQQLRAKQVSLAADAGDISIASTIDASGKSGGSIELFANRVGGNGGHVTLAAGSLLKANATAVAGNGNSGRGGSVIVGVSASTAADESGTGIDFAAAAGDTAAAKIDVSAAPGSSAANGSVVFRAPRQDTEQALQTLAGTAIDPSASALTVLSGAGNATAYTIATTMTDYKPGMVAVFTAGATSSGALTLNVNGKGAKALVQADGSPFSSTTKINKDQVVTAVYDGTKFVVSSIGLADTGTSNAYKVAFSSKPSALTTGMVVTFKAKSENTAGTSTLAVNGEANLTKNLVDQDGNPLAAKAILANQLVTAVYDGTQFRLIKDTSLVATPAITASTLAGSVKLDGSIVGAASSSLEAVRTISKTYDIGINSERQRAYLAQTKTAASLLAKTPTGFALVPGLQLISTRDITVSDDWNLSSARYNGQPGTLTLRAEGNLNINGTISDGFNGVARDSTIMSGNAWSMRLVAGADSDAANPLAINGNASGDLAIAGNKLLRTTSGLIDLAAGRDIILGGTTAAPATVMVTGTPSELDPDLAAAFTNPAGAVFTKNGGHISATAGNDIKSPASDQLLIDNWFSRSGRLDTDTGMYYDNVAWWSRFDLFRHGFGSFGGGNIVLSAGGNMQNVSAVAPSSARMASTTPDMSRLIVENGGDIEVTAGGNIAGGAYFVGRGEGKLSAGGSITKGSSPASNVGQLAPVLAMMDGSWTLRAQSDIGITTAFNPTIFNARKETSFYTYSDAARLDVASTAGSISWPSVAQNVFSSLAKLATASAEKMTLIDTDYLTLNVLPPNVRLTAFEGGINLSANSTNALGVSLFPSATGNLELYSGGDTLINTSVRIMDNDPASLPGIVNFTEGTAATLFVGMPGGITSYDINKLVLTDLHAGDNDPVRIHADGSITVTDGRLILSPKQTRISAGMDITNLSLYGQHHQASDVTQISAGRNILSTTIVPTRGLISLAGPGTLELTAGRQLSLGASAGVETTGNIYNPLLSAEGASIRMAAGLAATLDADGFSSFVTNYLGASGAPSGSSYRQALVDYVKKTLNQDASATYTDDEALAAFSGFSSAGRIAFVKTVLAEEFGRTYLAAGKPYATAWAQAAAKAGVASDVYGGETFERMRNEVLFAELKLGGIAGSSAKGATAKEAGYAQGYKAIDLAGYGSPFDFVGNIDLIQSKVQTKSGGDIEFIAPGGGVNVGLSADVSNAVGGKKTSDKRGVVAYANGNIRSFSDGNFLVNAQKVFVIGAGDILLWSSNGDIDSGKGSNNTVTVPPLVPKIDPKDGSISFELPSLATGSGIGILDASDGKADGAAYLFAPHGEVVALDAFIRAPVVYFDPDKIRGADNVIGVAVNPVSTPASVSVGGLGSVTANPADSLATASVAPKSGEKEKNSILTVEVLAMGDGATGSTGGKTTAEPADESTEKKAKRRKCVASEPESDCVTKL